MRTDACMYYPRFNLAAIFRWPPRTPRHRPRHSCQREDNTVHRARAESGAGGGSPGAFPVTRCGCASAPYWGRRRPSASAPSSSPRVSSRGTGSPTPRAAPAPSAGSATRSTAPPLRHSPVSDEVRTVRYLSLCCLLKRKLLHLVT